MFLYVSNWCSILDFTVTFTTTVSSSMMEIMTTLDRVSIIWLRVVLLARFASWGSTMAVLWMWRRSAMTGPVAPLGAYSAPGKTFLV